MRKPEMYVEDEKRMIEILKKGGSLISAGKGLRRNPKIIELALSIKPEDIVFVPRDLQGKYQQKINSTPSPFVTYLTAEDLFSIIDGNPLAKQVLKNEGDNSISFEICEIRDREENKHFNKKLEGFISEPSRKKQAFLITINNTHWVSLLLKKNDMGGIEYQYGDSLLNPINDTLKTHIPEYIEEKSFISTPQEKGTNNCGIHAIFDLVAMSQGKSRSIITTLDAKKIRQGFVQTTNPELSLENQYTGWQERITKVTNTLRSFASSMFR